MATLASSTQGLRQEDYKFKGSLGHTVRPCHNSKHPAWTRDSFECFYCVRINEAPGNQPCVSMPPSSRLGRGYVIGFLFRVRSNMAPQCKGVCVECDSYDRPLSSCWLPSAPTQVPAVIHGLSDRTQGNSGHSSSSAHLDVEDGPTSSRAVFAATIFSTETLIPGQD